MMSKWLVQSNPEEVTPLDDFKQHISGIKCWCKPILDETTLVHNAMDKREEYENGRKLS